jgi:hypothetical protein
MNWQIAVLIVAVGVALYRGMAVAGNLPWPKNLPAAVDVAGYIILAIVSGFSIHLLWVAYFPTAIAISSIGLFLVCIAPLIAEGKRDFLSAMMELVLLRRKRFGMFKLMQREVRDE